MKPSSKSTAAQSRRFSLAEPLEARIAPATFTVLNTNDAGAGSFRQAILNANANAGADIIDFNIPGNGVHVILPLSALPFLNGPTLVNAQTESDFAGTPLIEINGASAGANASGLTVNFNGCEIRGLAIHSFNQSGLTVFSSNTIVKGCYLGLNATGAKQGNNLYGILLSGSNNTLGGVTASERNVISGNASFGVFVPQTATNNLIQGNYIGTNVAGTGSIANTNHGLRVEGSNNDIGGLLAGQRNVISGNSFDGLNITGSDNEVLGNYIGTNATGTAAVPNGLAGVAFLGTPSGGMVGGLDPAARNVISGNSGNGVYIQGSQIEVYGNYIGLNAAGTAALANGVNGVYLVSGGSNSIGSNHTNGANIIVASKNYGVLVESPNNVIQANLIGTNGAAPMGNKYGIVVQGNAANTMIGGTDDGDGNTIVASKFEGVYLTGAGNTTLLGNYIGTNDKGDALLGNLGYGVYVYSPNVHIGDGTKAGGNIISGNAKYGAVLYGNNLDFVGNIVGLAPNGIDALPNAMSGLYFYPFLGTSTLKNNTISGNLGHGILLEGTGTGSIVGNKIGLSEDGMQPVPNGATGIEASYCTNQTIGGPNVADRNLISANGANGIHFIGGSGNSVLGNWIGVDATGLAAQGNTLDGISLEGSANNTIGAPGAGNVISGNMGFGVRATFGSNGLDLVENVIGLNATKSAPVPNAHGVIISNSANASILYNSISGNTGDGVKIEGVTSAGAVIKGNAISANLVTALILEGVPNVTIGGPAPTDVNGISGSNFGVRLSGPDTHDVVIRNNNIGNHSAYGLLIEDDAHDISVEGNFFQNNAVLGLHIKNAHDVTVKGSTFTANHTGLAVSGDSSGIVVGGPGAGNTIFANSTRGVSVLDTASVLLTRNLIYNNPFNLDLGANGNTPNDAMDADAGPNGLTNRPILQSAAVVNGDTIVQVRMQGLATHTYTLEFFAGSGGTNAQSFVGTASITTEPDGEVVQQFNLGPTPAGMLITGTARLDETQETSELSDAAYFFQAVSINDVQIVEGNSGMKNLQFSLTTPGAPGVGAKVDFTTVNGTAKAGVDFTLTNGTATLNAAGGAFTIDVPILGEFLAEPDQIFTVQLSNPQNLFILDATGIGTILNDDTTLIVAADGKSATWKDLDGDNVTLLSDKPILDPTDFKLLPDGNGGEQLALLDLSNDFPLASNASLVFFSKVDPSAAQPGDGTVNVGRIDASGVDLKSVLLRGDLGSISAGDATTKTPALGSLVAGSIGFFGLATQGGKGTLVSELTGGVTSLRVLGDFGGERFTILGGQTLAHGKLTKAQIFGNVSTALSTTGDIGLITISGGLMGGALNDSGSIAAGGKLGSLIIGGSVSGGDGARSGSIHSGGLLGSVIIKGSLTGNDGTLSGSIFTNPGSKASIGKVTVAGDVRAGSAVSGILSDGKLGSVTIGGVLEGSASQSAHITAIGKLNAKTPAEALAIGSVKINGGAKYAEVLAGYDSTLAAVNGAAQIGAVKCGGSWIASNLVAGADRGADGLFGTLDDALIGNPAANVAGKIASITIAGQVQGTVGGTDSFGFVAKTIGKASVANVLYKLNAKAADVHALGSTGDFALREDV